MSLLNAAKIDYLVIGGYAVNHYGYVRNTGDLDVWIPVRPQIAEKVTAALIEFGFNDAATDPGFFLKPKRIIRMGVPPLRIEVTNGIAGVEFDACYARRVHMTKGGMAIPVIALDDLIANKLAAGRLKDLADVEYLRKVARRRTASD